MVDVWGFSSSLPCTALENKSFRAGRCTRAKDHCDRLLFILFNTEGQGDTCGWVSVTVLRCHLQVDALSHWESGSEASLSTSLQNADGHPMCTGVRPPAARRDTLAHIPRVHRQRDDYDIVQSFFC
jgi:hypothetical protein